MEISSVFIVTHKLTKSKLFIIWIQGKGMGVYGELGGFSSNSEIAWHWTCFSTIHIVDILEGFLKIANI